MVDVIHILNVLIQKVDVLAVNVLMDLMEMEKRVAKLSLLKINVKPTMVVVIS
jgi:hypothetical protein